ncbi:MAG: gluconate 2-dehydrogenase subunit 3 family protein [Gemmatimonadetes bacterium]|nr:gluconate 2-dehydrogenase subunit 3 family protein [Gemmatimonadota bacterium]
MDRRELLRALGASAVLAGLSPSQLTALLNSGAPRALARAFFTAEQRETVDALAEAIIPATDTPGASEAGVTDFIEVLVAEWFDGAQRAHFMRGLAHVDEHTVALTGVRFPYAGPETQTAVLAGLQAEGAALREAADGIGSGATPPFFQQFRSLVLHGYYTSEVGMQEELMFRRLPGRFEGCVDVASVTRAVPGGTRG